MQRMFIQAFAIVSAAIAFIFSEPAKAIPIECTSACDQQYNLFVDDLSGLSLAAMFEIADGSIAQEDWMFVVDPDPDFTIVSFSLTAFTNDSITLAGNIIATAELPIFGLTTFSFDFDEVTSILSLTGLGTVEFPYVVEVKIPEPSTFGLFAIGLAGVGVMFRRRRKQHNSA